LAWKSSQCGRHLTRTDGQPSLRKEPREQRMIGANTESPAFLRGNISSALHPGPPDRRWRPHLIFLCRTGPVLCGPSRTRRTQRRNSHLPTKRRQDSEVIEHLSRKPLTSLVTSLVSPEQILLKQQANADLGPILVCMARFSPSFFAPYGLPILVTVQLRTRKRHPKALHKPKINSKFCARN